MAKGKDVDIVTDLENLQSFTQFLSTKTGLIVCECYQDWAGPCVVMKRFLKKAKFDMLEGEDWDLVTYCSEMVTREKLYIVGKAKRHVLSDVIPYVFPDEDPPLPELEILASPVLPPKEEVTLTDLLEEPPAEAEEAQPERHLSSQPSEETAISGVAHQKRGFYPEEGEGQSKRQSVEKSDDEVNTESSSSGPSNLQSMDGAPRIELLPLPPVVAPVDEQNPGTTSARLDVGLPPDAPVDILPLMTAADQSPTKGSTPMTILPGITQPVEAAEPGFVPLATSTENESAASPPAALPPDSGTGGPVDAAEAAAAAEINPPTEAAEGVAVDSAVHPDVPAASVQDLTQVKDQIPKGPGQTNNTMDAIKKKMQAMKLEKENAMDRADAQEGKSREAEKRAEKAEEDVKDLQKKIQQIENMLDETQEKLLAKEKALEEADKKSADAEAEVAALNRRIQLLEEDLERTEERLKSATSKLEEACAAADESERARKSLENRSNLEDDRISQLEVQLSQARALAEEADRKYEEVARKLVMVEADLERAEERAEAGEMKIVELEEELRVVGNNLKSLEVSEEKALQREDSYEEQIRVMTTRLKEAETRAEFAERSVQKLQKEVDRLEDDVVHEKERYKLISDELDQTFSELSGY